MTTIRFASASFGGWTTFVAGARLLAVADGGDEAFVDRVWTGLRGEKGFQSTLEFLASGGLAATPSFVLLEWDATVLRTIVRGPVTVSVTTAEEDVTLSGAGLSTWIERSIPGAASSVIEVQGAKAIPGPSLPLREGVVLAATIVVAHKSADESPARIVHEVAVDTDVEATRTDAPGDDGAPAAPQHSADLSGDTVYRPIPRTGEAVESPTVAEGDHDGHTVLVSDVSAMRSAQKPRSSAKTTAKTTAKAKARAKAVPAPKVSVVLTLPNGDREPLTRPVLVGRLPSVNKLSSGVLPRLVTVGSDDPDISRNHTQFVLEGDTVVVTDLHSRNGTTVVIPGHDAQKLRAGEPTSVIVGTVVDLGGGVILKIEDAQPVGTG